MFKQTNTLNKEETKEKEMHEECDAFKVVLLELDADATGDHFI